LIGGNTRSRPNIKQQQCSIYKDLIIWQCQRQIGRVQVGIATLTVKEFRQMGGLYGI